MKVEDPRSEGTIARQSSDATAPPGRGATAKLALPKSLGWRYGRARIDNMDRAEKAMADKGIPHFHNDPGLPVIHIGAKEFQCIGAMPPHDHPHVYLDMGDEAEIVCPYCSTLYQYRGTLPADSAEPAECRYEVGV